MRLSRVLALGASTLVLVGACSTGGGSSSAPAASPGASAPAATSAAPSAPPPPTIKIGSVGFDEARVMAELYAQVLEAHGYTVNRDGIGLGDRKVLLPALESGQIDLQPEYIGSGLAAGYGGTSTNDPAKNKTDLQAALDAKGVGITVLDYTPAVDTNALVVRKDTADQDSLTKWSDLAAVQDKLKWGLAEDCPTNPVCSGALKDQYGVDTTKIDVTLLGACTTPMSDALKAKTIDVAELCSTDPLIITENWVRLEDDKHTQPADNISPLVRNDYLAKVDKEAFSKILNDVSAKVDTPTLADLYKQVAVDKKDAKDVAATWLKANGFVQ
jgi:osmoprotectant transport system substrate-binding protein